MRGPTRPLLLPLLLRPRRPKRPPNHGPAQANKEGSKGLAVCLGPGVQGRWRGAWRTRRKRRRNRRGACTHEKAGGPLLPRASCPSLLFASPLQALGERKLCSQVFKRFLAGQNSDDAMAKIDAWPFPGWACPLLCQRSAPPPLFFPSLCTSRATRNAPPGRSFRVRPRLSREMPGGEGSSVSCSWASMTRARVRKMRSCDSWAFPHPCILSPCPPPNIIPHPSCRVWAGALGVAALPAFFSRVALAQVRGGGLWRPLEPSKANPTPPPLVPAPTRLVPTLPRAFWPRGMDEVMQAWPGRGG